MQVENLKEKFKDKKLMFAGWGNNIETHYQKRDWIPALKKIFDNLIIFSQRDLYFHKGKEFMNKEFLKILKKEQPYFLLLALNYDEFFLETLYQIKKFSPKTIVLSFYGDDNWRYDDWSRYYSLFTDYLLVTEKEPSYYEEDGFNPKKIFFVHGTNTNLFLPKKLKKIYDVSFIGGPIRDRPDYIKFLKEKGIHVKVFGVGWSKFPELKDIYGNIPSSEEYVKIINQTKINLNFSKSALKEQGERDTQFKGRILEVLSTKSFILTEKFYHFEKFPKHFQKIVFKTPEELLKKIKYYLKHDKEKDQIVEKLYKEVKENYSWENSLFKFFNNFSKQFSLINKSLIIQKDLKDNHKKFLFEKKILKLTKNDFKLEKNTLSKKLENFDYIKFDSGIKHAEHKLRDFFQIYSLEKSKKQISCCDYFYSSYFLKDYLLFMAKKTFKSTPKSSFENLIYLENLMVTKDFFLEKYEEFVFFFKGKTINLINDTNTVFVSIPLISIKKFKKINFEILNKAYRLKFLDNLYPIYFQKKFSFYPLWIFISAIFGKKFIFKIFKELLFNKENKYKLQYL